MGKEIWQQERDELRAVLEDLDSGKIKMEQGQAEYVASVKRRIAMLDLYLAKRD